MHRPLVTSFLAAALASVAICQSPQRRGYQQQDGLYAGTFEDLLNKVDLRLNGDQVTGQCDRGGPWQLAGKLEHGAVRGTATSAAGEELFAARFDGDRLLVRIGELETPFCRTIPVDAKLADLGAPVVDPARQWTLAVYLGGDNDLENAAIDDLMEMVRGLPEHGVEVVVLLDRAEHEQQGKGIWSDTRVLHLRRGAEDPIETLATPGELDTGDARTLAGFLSGAFRKYPAPHRAVVIWDHGGGWTGVVQDQNAPGVDGGRDMLDLADVRLALQTAQVRCNMLQRFDLVAFDACLMAHLETAVAVMDAADWLVASQASVPGTGFPYEQVLPLLATAQSGGEVARGIVQAFGQSYEALHDSSVTLCAVDLAKVPRIAAALDRLAAAVLPELGDNWPALGRALFYGESYEPRTRRATDQWHASLDLLDVLYRLRSGMRPFPAAAAAALQELERDLPAAVVARHAGEQRAQSHGLSVFGPYRHSDLLPVYATTAVGAGNHWKELLDKLHMLSLGELADLRLDGIAVKCGKDGDRAVVRPFNGDSIGFDVTGKAVVQVEQWDCWHDGEQWLVMRKNLVTDPGWTARLSQAVADEMDRLMPQFVDGKNHLSIELSGMQFLIDNRSETMRRATIDLLAPSSQAPFVVRAELAVAGAAAQPVEVHFDRAWWRAIGVYPLQCPEGQLEARRIVPTADSEFRFVLETVQDDGTRGEALTEPYEWKDGLWLVLDRDEPGRYRAELVARTLDGRAAQGRVDYELVASDDLERWIGSWQGYDPELLKGSWPQSRVVGPEQWQKTPNTAKFVGRDPMGPGVFRVDCELGPKGKDGVSHQTWVVELRGVPNLRVITEIADGRTFCWYGPAGWGQTGERPFLVMKALNVGGVIWRWQQSVLDSLLLEPPAQPKKGGG